MPYQDKQQAQQSKQHATSEATKVLLPHLSTSQLRQGRQSRKDRATCPWLAVSATGPASVRGTNSLHRLHFPRYMNNSVPGQQFQGRTSSHRLVIEYKLHRGYRLEVE